MHMIVVIVLDLGLPGVMCRVGSGAPLSWTNEGADTLFRLRASEEGSGLPRGIRAERAQRAKHQNRLRKGSRPRNAAHPR